MNAADEHPFEADLSFDGGELDCGNGLLLMIRSHLDRLDPGQLLEIRSTETSVEEDLPAWCRLTGNQLVSWTKKERQRSYLVCRGEFAASQESTGGQSRALSLKEETLRKSGEEPLKVESALGFERAASEKKLHPEAIKALSVMGIGSWPRPAWLLPYLHKHIEGRISDAWFDEIADDAVKLCVQAQIDAGVDLLSDGEQRRDNYASFVGMRLNGCQLIPLLDLLPLVDDPEEFQKELQSLDVPADKVRHPAVNGKLSRKGSLTLPEYLFLSSISSLPAKVAIPGPYLLSRIMWMECISDKAYDSREDLACDIVRILREEINDLLSAGAALVQLDEPVLTELVLSADPGLEKKQRTFMCGALSEKGSLDQELDFARNLLNQVLNGFDSKRLAVHVCRGNWTPDETAALSGGYEPLLPLFNSIEGAGTLFLEFCTERAGSLKILRDLREDYRVGLGCVNPKSMELESIEWVCARIEQCHNLIGAERLLLNPDCGFATFADNPVSSAQIASKKLAVLKAAALRMQEKYL